MANTSASRADRSPVVASHVAAVLAAFAAPAAVLAQEAPRTALEEVTVTARKTTETLISVPLAVTAISAEDIELRGMADITDVADYTPGFQFQNQSVGRNDRGFKQYVIRGMVPNSALATRQAVMLFVDGAPVSGGNILGLTDVERVEVIKGPQSAFFGRSTFAGAINFVTRAPGFEWAGQGTVDVASFGTTDLTASIEGPVIDDKLAFRLGGRSYETDGQYTNVGSPGERLGARDTQALWLSLFAQPTENLSMRAFVSSWNDSDQTLPANSRFDNSYHNCAAGAAGATINYICGELPDPDIASRRWDTYIYPIGLEYLQGKRGTGITLHGANFLTHLGLERDAYQARLTADYALPRGYTLSALAATGLNRWGFLQTIANIDNRAIPNPFYGTRPDVLPYQYALVLGNTQDKDQTFELRLTSPVDSALKWTLGASYNDNRTDNLTTIFGNTGYFAGTPHTINQSDTYGVFGSVSYEFGGGFTATAEGRYQKDELFQQTLAGSNPKFEDEFTAFTPRVILQYELGADRMMYASYAEGNRPGEFNTIFFAQPPEIQEEIREQANVQGVVPEDEIKIVEIGTKGLFLDGRLRLLADIYYGEWTNRHIPNYVYFTGTNGLPQSIQVTAPNGVVDVQGIELEAAYAPTPELTLEATLGFNQTDIRETFCTDCQLTTGDESPVGTQLPYYPELSGTLSGTYVRPVFGDWDGSLRVDYLYTGKMYDSEANVNWTAPASKVNLRLGLENDQYRVELYGTNIFDDKTATSLARTAQTLYLPTGATAGQAQSVTVSLADRAAFGLRATVRF